VVKVLGNSFVIPKGMCELPVKIGTVSISTPVLFVQTEPVINSNKLTLVVSGNRVELKPAIKDVAFEFSKISLKVYDHTHMQGHSAKRVLVS
jgi:hypothetical protein